MINLIAGTILAGMLILMDIIISAGILTGKLSIGSLPKLLFVNIILVSIIRIIIKAMMADLRNSGDDEDSGVNIELREKLDKIEKEAE